MVLDAQAAIDRWAFAQLPDGVEPDRGRHAEFTFEVWDEPQSGGPNGAVILSVPIVGEGRYPTWDVEWGPYGFDFAAVLAEILAAGTSEEG